MSNYTSECYLTLFGFSAVISQEYQPDHVGGALEDRIHADVRADLQRIREIKLAECKAKQQHLETSC